MSDWSYPYTNQVQYELNSNNDDDDDDDDDDDEFLSGGSVGLSHQSPKQCNLGLQIIMEAYWCHAVQKKSAQTVSSRRLTTAPADL